MSRLSPEALLTVDVALLDIARRPRSQPAMPSTRGLFHVSLVLLLRLARVVC